MAVGGIGPHGSERTRSRLNPTVLPDQYLKSWTPIFLIRHPALAFPSHCRKLLEYDKPAVAGIGKGRSVSLTMTLRWSRVLFDWYATLHRDGSECAADPYASISPIILDADDLIEQPKIVERLAEVMGMDVASLRFSWAPAREEELEKMTPIRASCSLP